MTKPFATCMVTTEMHHECSKLPMYTGYTGSEVHDESNVFYR